MNVEVQWGWENLRSSMNVKFNGVGLLYSAIPLLIFPRQEGCGRNGCLRVIVSTARWIYYYITQVRHLVCLINNLYNINSR